MDELLIELRACKEAKIWAQGKTFEEVYTTCERGEWLNWLFARTNPEDDKLLTLVKGHQANTVRHLMKDERSHKAVDTAIAYGEGRATEEELSRVAIAVNAYATYTSYADSAARDAVNVVSGDSAGSAARAAYSDAAYAAYAAEQANQKLTADIFRKYISIDKFKI